MEADDSKSDYHMEVANTGFGDMLHDYERNQKYFAALRKTIGQMHAKGIEAHVLDIGTGTGILAMMAVAAGADSVTACEVFLPMANCAERIFTANGMADKIHLIKRRSTDIVIGNGSDDMKRRANVLVTEVLDTELIGEGAISIYNHAHKELLTADVICIPARAHCFAQVVQSSLAYQWNTLKTLANCDGDILLKPPDDVLQCKGEAALHDVQLSQLPLDAFFPITAAVKIFEFDFSSKQPLELNRRTDITLSTTNGGSTDLVFYWWDIDMDAESEIQLSCAPFWAHADFKAQSNHVKKSIEAGVPLPNSVPWRDHWMQAIYYIPRPLHFNSAGKEFILNCYHDEYSLWFDAVASNASSKVVPRHACTCQLHISYSRSRIAQLNQSQRNKKYLRYLEKTIQPAKSQVLTLSDGCLLGLATAKIGAASVLCLEPHRLSRQFLKKVAEKNDIKNVEFIESTDKLKATPLESITHIFAEPYFMHSILPWDNLYFGYLLRQIRDKLPANVEIAPHSARVFAVPVEFLDLHRIRIPVRECESFDLSLFDRMVEESITLALSNVEAHPLWEYPCRALALQQELINITFKDFEQSLNKSGIFNIEHNGSCNGIALWVDWHLDNSRNSKSIISTGPNREFIAGEIISWDMFVRQGVHLIAHPKMVECDKNKVQWSCKFVAESGELEFSFAIDNVSTEKNYNSKKSRDKIVL